MVYCSLIYFFHTLRDNVKYIKLPSSFEAMAHKNFNKEMRSYITKKRRKPFFSFTKKFTSKLSSSPTPKASDAYKEYEELSGISDTGTTVLQGNENVFDTIKKSVNSLIHKEKKEQVPAFDEHGNVIRLANQSSSPEPSALEKGGHLVSHLFSKIDVFDVLGKKNETAQAEYQELKEFDEVLTTTKDITDLARISALALRQLSPEKLEEFKRSDDYKVYKTILRKHKIIK